MMSFNQNQYFHQGVILNRQKIMMSVDMDEWYHCRWATGTPTSKWPDTITAIKEYYGSDKPLGEIIPPTHKILRLFKASDIEATFFITGEVANFYPELVKEISEEGHEISSHNMIHQDYNQYNLSMYSKHLKKSKRILEKLAGEKIKGYRAPNLVMTNEHIRMLIKSGFTYDSSVTPTRPIAGKYGRFTKAPVNPYRLSFHDFSTLGDSPLFEIPFPVFPYFKFPSGSGITTRMFGYWYVRIALDYALKKGSSLFYFHPYEIGTKPNVTYESTWALFQMRRIGVQFYRNLVKLIKRYKGNFTSGREIVELYS